MNHRKFLDKFDCAQQAADAFNVTVRDISHWKIRGVPARYWPAAERIGRLRGWDVSASGLHDARPKKPVLARDLVAA